MTTSPSPVRLYGGVVAYNEEARICPAIRSLLEQELPKGSTWTEICVVASGCTDGTAEVVRELARSDPRVRLVVQPERLGKSAGMAEIFERCDGDWVVLLNGDAEALPGAVALLLEAAARPGPRPMGVMARPVPPESAGSFSDAIGLLWRALNGYWLDRFRRGEGDVLMDEMMMLSTAPLPPIRAGIVNDGDFLAAWVRASHGTLRYASTARVRIAVPRSMMEFIRQRRRVRAGHRQASAMGAPPPSTIGGWLVSSPIGASRALFARAREGPSPLRSLLGLAVAEAAALFLSWCDRGSRDADNARWARVESTGGPSTDRPPLPSRVSAGPK